jgi:serine/threonine protein kinase/regulator of sirC expression with transglutaminase-like and TPR domain
MSMLDLLKKRIKLISILVTREELRSVLDSTVLPTPAGARFKVGDTIHPPNNSALGKLKVYGAKAGGYGFVYIVLEEETLTPYCLKTFHEKFFDDADRVNSFTQEAETWIGLEKHPNIVHAHCVLNMGGRPYVVLEYVAGSDLSCKVRNGPIPVRSALKYAIQLSRGMMHAQTKLPGFIHGDIKPANCLLTKDDTLKITDFGLATGWAEPWKLSKHPTPAEGMESLHERVNAWAAGTPAYMAPERFDASRKVDVRSDIYAFGVTLFEMLTGTRPFTGKKHEECFEQHRSAIVRDPVSLNADVPRQLADVTLRCLRKSPADRPENFTIVEHELSSLLRNIYQEEVPHISSEDLTDLEWINRGVSLLALDRYDEALICFEKILAGEPQSARVWSHKGTALSGCERYEEALACFDRALAIDTQLASSWGSKGETLNLLGRPAEALACFNRALALDPQLAFVWSDKGRALTDLGQFTEAVICLERALVLNPQHVEAHHSLGLAHYGLGRDEEAIVSYQRAIKLKPQYAEAYCDLGKAYARLRRFKPTIESYRQAMNMKPGYQEAQAGLSEAYREFYTTSNQFVNEEYAEKLIAFLLSEQHEVEVIIPASIELLELSKFDPAVLYLCGDKIYLATGEIKGERKGQLIRILAEARANVYFRGDSDAFYWLGKILYGLDLYDECQDVFQRSTKLFGPDDRALYYVAACNEIRGNHEAALNHYQQSLTFDPDCFLTLDGIRRMEAKLALQSVS